MMKAFTVHVPPREERAAERAVFIKDGMSWPALFVPVLWLLWHRLWLLLLLYLLLALGVAGIERLTGGATAVLLGFLGSVLFALEANNLRRWALERRGWRQVGATFGHNPDEAEIRYFHEVHRAAAAPEAERPAAPARTPPTAAREDGDEDGVFGVFPRADA